MDQIHLNSVFALMLAYLDPGSGSILIQLLISVLIGVGVFFRAKFGKLGNIFKKKTDAPTEEELEDDIDV